MVVNKGKDMLGYVADAIKSYMQINNIEMEENLGIHVIVTDTSLEEDTIPAHDTYIGFPNVEEIHTDLVKELYKEKDDPGIITLDANKN